MTTQAIENKNTHTPYNSTLVQIYVKKGTLYYIAKSYFKLGNPSLLIFNDQVNFAYVKVFKVLVKSEFAEAGGLNKNLNSVSMLKLLKSH